MKNEMKRTVIVMLECVLFLSGALTVSSYTFGGPHGTRQRRDTEDFKCTLPPFPEHGMWKLIKGTAEKPGDKISTEDLIKFECNSGYLLSHPTPFIECDDSWNTAVMPECEKSCPPLYSSDIFNLTCKHKTGRDIKCNAVTHGSFVDYTCASFYEIPFGYKNSLLCEDGKWNQKPVCHPVCGKKLTKNAITLIYGSKPNEKLEYPWITAIYAKENNTYKNICGGSILSQTVVLTAAHCVTDHNGVVLPKENYIVGVGKLYNKYQDPRDTYAQYLELSHIIVNEEYKGDSRRFSADIAVLVTKEQFVINEVVQPICFSELKTIHLNAGNIGEVSGWGLSEGEIYSDVLRTLAIPYKYHPICIAELPPDFEAKYNMADKICAGFINQSTSVCNGDSGNGLAFNNRENSRFYIHGIVSLGPLKGTQCNIQHNSLYTNVAFHYNFVARLLTKYDPKVNDCKLPPYPKHGKWTSDKKEKKPGDFIPSSTVLSLECNKGYKLSSSNINLTCDTAHNMPICQLLCPALNFTKATKYECRDKEGQIINCLDAVDGAILEYHCPKGYTENSDYVRICQKDSWGDPHPQCVRIHKNCGRRFSNVSTSLNSSETVEGGSQLPWNVGIYKRDLEEFYSYCCAGSLISNTVILTAAHCVTDELNILIPKNVFMMAVGKIHSQYNDSRDEHAQYSKVSNVIIHPRYNRHRNLPPNIAMLHAETSFTFDSFVQPICFLDVETIKLNPDDKGVMSGWKTKGKDISNDHEVVETVYKYLHKRYCEKSWFIYYHHCTNVLVLPNCTYDGDSGKGFAVKNPEDDRYYIHGIVNNLTGPEKCNQTTEYTSIARYYKFINCVVSNLFPY